MTKKFIYLPAFLLTVGLGFASPAFSQTPTPSTCPPLYNGGIVCQEAKDFSVDKKAQAPLDGSFVDFLPENETKTAPGNTMIFRIEVKNKTTRTLRGIAVTDTLPGFVQFVKSDSSVKQNGEKVTYTIATLETKKSHTVNIEARVKSRESLPKDSGPLCVANEVEAKSGFNSVGRDFVTFCIDATATAVAAQASDSVEPTFPTGTKGGQPPPTPSPTQTSTTKGGQQVYPAPSTDKNPNTGPELFALIGLIPAAAAGFLLRKKTNSLH